MYHDKAISVASTQTCYSNSPVTHNSGEQSKRAGRAGSASGFKNQLAGYEVRKP